MRRYTERIHVTVPKEQKVRLKERAKLEGVSLSELARRITQQFDESLNQ